MRLIAELLFIQLPRNASCSSAMQLRAKKKVKNLKQIKLEMSFEKMQNNVSVLLLFIDYFKAHGTGEVFAGNYNVPRETSAKCNILQLQAMRQ